MGHGDSGGRMAAAGEVKQMHACDVSIHRSSRIPPSLPRPSSSGSASRSSRSAARSCSRPRTRSSACAPSRTPRRPCRATRTRRVVVVVGWWSRGGVEGSCRSLARRRVLLGSFARARARARAFLLVCCESSRRHDRSRTRGGRFRVGPRRRRGPGGAVVISSLSLSLVSVVRKSLA